MIKVTVELVHASFSEFTDLRMLKDAIRVGAVGEKLADHRIGSYADRFVVLNWYDRRS